MKVIGNTLQTENMTIRFHRTFRLPEDGKTYPLPPNLGEFPVKRIDDYKDKVPKEWAEKGGIFLPMYQREAMWISFQKRTHAPCAVKVGVGKVNAITGEPWENGLNGEMQDYLVAPPQKWLDGIKSADGAVKQFVAMPLGMGYTVEGQVTGEETHGGLQLAIYPGKRSRFPKPKTRGIGSIRRRSAKGGGKGSGQSMGLTPTSMNWAPDSGFEEYCGEVQVVNSVEQPTSGSFLMNDCEPSRGISPSYNAMAQDEDMFIPHMPKAAAMGLGAGGSMRQKIYADPHGIEAWDQNCRQRVFVHLVNAEMYYQITGERPPKCPISRDMYVRAGYPFYDLWDHDLADVAVSDALSKVKTLSEKDKEHGFTGQQDDTSVPVKQVINSGTPEVVKDKETVRDGAW